MKIYVASSWRNPHQQEVIEVLRHQGYEVYDFRHPKPGDEGFHWSAIEERWQEWSPAEFRAALDHPIAKSGFAVDHAAMEWADTFVLVLSCGRSAHLEAGWACGAGKRTFILILEPTEPELMYREVYASDGGICTSVTELVERLAAVATSGPAPAASEPAVERGAVDEDALIEVAAEALRRADWMNGGATGAAAVAVRAILARVQASAAPASKEEKSHE